MSGQGIDDQNGPGHPGMLGDETEEQNLNQPGNKTARITEGEVDEAFSGQPQSDDEEEDDEENEQTEESSYSSLFWNGFAWGAAVVLAAVCLLPHRRSNY